VERFRIDRRNVNKKEYGGGGRYTAKKILINRIVLL
jgi:hypothetical protein